MNETRVYHTNFILCRTSFINGPESRCSLSDFPEVVSVLAGEPRGPKDSKVPRSPSVGCALL